MVMASILTIYSRMMPMDVQEGNHRRTIPPPEPFTNDNITASWAVSLVSSNLLKATHTVPAGPTEKKLFTVQSMNEDTSLKDINHYQRVLSRH